MPTTPISTNSAPGVAPPLYPGMLQPYLLQQAMAGGTPLGAALPFYPNFLQQLARFQNQAQLSNLLQTKRASTPVPLSTGKESFNIKSYHVTKRFPHGGRHFPKIYGGF